MKPTTFKEYARVELISVLSSIPPNNEAMFLTRFCNEIYNHNGIKSDDVFKLFSDRKMRKEFAEFYKTNEELSTFRPDDMYDVIMGSYILIKLLDALVLILKKNIKSLYNKNKEDLILQVNKETLDFIISGLTKNSFIY